MQLTVTSAALERLDQLKDDDDFLLLWFDTEGLGCTMNGMPTIRLTSEKKPNYLPLESGDVEAYVVEEKAVFFAKKMKLDVQAEGFRLSSPEGILNAFIPSGKLTS